MAAIMCVCVVLCLVIVLYVKHHSLLKKHEKLREDFDREKALSIKACDSAWNLNRKVSKLEGILKHEKYLMRLVNAEVEKERKKYEKLVNKVMEPFLEDTLLPPSEILEMSVEQKVTMLRTHGVEVKKDEN